MKIIIRRYLYTTNKKGFVTLPVVLWMTLALSIILIIYNSVHRRVEMIKSASYIENYKRKELYKDLVEDFELKLNERLIEDEFLDISKETYYLKTIDREYIIEENKELLGKIFILKVKNNLGKEILNANYSYDIRNGKVVFQRRSDYDW